MDLAKNDEVYKSSDSAMNDENGTSIEKLNIDYEKQRVYVKEIAYVDANTDKIKVIKEEGISEEDIKNLKYNDKEIEELAYLISLDGKNDLGWVSYSKNGMQLVQEVEFESETPNKENCILIGRRKEKTNRFVDNTQTKVGQYLLKK